MAEENVEAASDARRRGVYGISTTADLVGTGVQNLRAYERRGLLEPTRTAGGTRLYSANDIDRLNRITQLLDDGLNLAGIAMVLELQDDNARLRSEVQQGPPDPRPPHFAATNGPSASPAQDSTTNLAYSPSDDEVDDTV